MKDILVLSLIATAKTVSAFDFLLERGRLTESKVIEIPFYKKSDEDGFYTRYFINMTFGTYPENVTTDKWKSHGAMQITTMDDRYEMFVAE